MSEQKDSVFDNAIVLPSLCEAHQALILHNLRMGPTEPWKAALVVANLMLFQITSAGDVMWQRAKREDGETPTSADVSLVLAEMGCLACFSHKNLERVLTIFRKHGLQGAAKISQGQLESPHWPYFKKQSDGGAAD